MSTVDVTGITTADINAASIAAGPGGTVFFPNNLGEYESDGLQVTVPDQTWVLERLAKIKRTDTTAATWTIQVLADNFRMEGGILDGNCDVNPNVGHGLTVQDFAVDMDRVRVQNCLYYGVLSHNNDLAMDKCEIVRTGQTGIFWRLLAGQPMIRGPRIERCLVDRSNPVDYINLGGIMVQATSTSRMWGTHIKGNDVLLPAGSTAYAAVSVEVLYGERGIVLGNNVQGGRIGISFGHNNHNTVIGNTMRYCYNYGIELAQDSNYNVASGNIIIGHSPTVSHGIEISGNSDYNKVGPNDIFSCSIPVNILSSVGTVQI